MSTFSPVCTGGVQAVLNQWFFAKRGKATALIIITQQVRPALSSLAAAALQLVSGLRPCARADHGSDHGSTPRGSAAAVRDELHGLPAVRCVHCGSKLAEWSPEHDPPATCAGVLLVSWGWRSASLLGFVMNLGAAPLFAMLLFHTPESVGLLPDGAAPRYSPLADDDDGGEELEDKPIIAGGGSSQTQPGVVAAAAGEVGEAFSFTREEAFRTLPVWLLMFDGFCGAASSCPSQLLQIAT